MEIRLVNNSLVLFFDKKVDFTVYCYYSDLINTKNFTFQSIELNFSKTEFVTLPAALYILFFINDIEKTKKKNNIYIETYITIYRENLIKALSNFGLINILKTYGNIKLNEEIDSLNLNYLNFWKVKVKINNYHLNNLYWPISTIPAKTGMHYEAEVGSFYNNFISYFDLLLNNSMIPNLNDDNVELYRNYFLKAVNESTKNVWDHSKSWGVAAIHSNKLQKTTFCLFDYGVGFINSYVLRKGGYERNKTSDLEVLNWLFIEGNRSNEEGNHGHGLSIILKFVDITKGILLIKTDKYMIQYTKNKGLLINESSFYPGVQIMINF